MNHYVYQITNNINGKIYVGKRSCRCDINNDKYFGSGTHLKSAIKKYGKQNFSKTIIDICETADQAYELEELIVDIDFIKRYDTYNLCGGGIGAGIGESNPMFGKIGELASMFGRKHSDESKAKISANNAKANLGKTLSEETRSKISINHGRINKGKTGELHPKFGKTLSEETRSKISTNHANKGKPRTDEVKAKISATLKAKNRSKLVSKNY